MIIVAFTIMGIIVGILATLAYAFHLADRKAETEAPSGIAAVSIPSGRGGVSIETSIPTNLLKQVFKHLEQGNA
jgi:hypothetical protein